MDYGDDWEWGIIEEAVRHDPSPTVQIQEAFDLFAKNIRQMNDSFCMVFAWEELKSLWPKNLEISLVSVVPKWAGKGTLFWTYHFLYIIWRMEK